MDVQHAQHPDLHGFRRHEHLAILLDEVQDPAFIVNNKKLLQAHVDGAILGQSATQMFTYEVFLWRVPIILTTNNWHLSGMSAADLDWIGANCVVVHIAEPVYACSRVPGLCPELFHKPRPRQSEGLELPAPPNRRRLSKSSSSQDVDDIKKAYARFCMDNYVFCAFITIYPLRWHTLSQEKMSSEKSVQTS